MNCSAVVAEANETSVLSPADWSYEQCPDVDECRLGRHDCHGNATCLNTYEGFDCRCNYGFKGDGKIFCNSTWVSTLSWHIVFVGLNWSHIVLLIGNNFLFCITTLIKCDDFEKQYTYERMLSKSLKIAKPDRKKNDNQSVNMLPIKQFWSLFFFPFLNSRHQTNIVMKYKWMQFLNGINSYT